MSETLGKFVDNRIYLSGPHEVDGASFGYIEGYGWIRAGMPGYHEPSMEIARMLNKEHWSEEGQHEACSDVPLIRHAGSTYGWRDGNWIEAEPNHHVRIVPPKTAHKLYALHGNMVSDHFFDQDTLIEHFGSEYGKKSSDGVWYDWYTFGRVENGKIMDALDRKLRKVREAALDKSEKWDKPNGRGHSPDQEFIFIEF